LFLFIAYKKPNKKASYADVSKKISEKYRLSGNAQQMKQERSRTIYSMALSKAMTKIGLSPGKFSRERRQIHALGRKMADANAEMKAVGERPEAIADSFSQILAIVREKKGSQTASDFSRKVATEIHKLAGR
jgi:dsRNA-specific ribonuclease